MEQQAHPEDPLENRPMRPFLVLWTGQALSLLGSYSVQFALIWWLTERTGSATILATATMIGLLPPVVLGPLIGALIDRWNRKHVMLAADALVAVTSLWIAVLFFRGSADLLSVFVALGARALGSAFHGPAMMASTSLMVPERHLSRIQGLNQSLQGGLTIAAAPLGALLLSLLSMGGIMLIDVATALVAIVPLVFIRVPSPDERRTDEAKPSVWDDIVDGFRYLRERRGHMTLLAGATVINLCLVPAFALLPLLVSSELGGGAMQLGWIQMSFGVGSIAGGILLGVWGGFQRRILTSLVGMFGMSASVLLLGLSPADGHLFPLASMLAVGLTVPLVNGPIMAIIQATVAADYQGRVFTLMGSLSGAMAPVGLLLAAPIAETFGVRFWYVTGGVVCAVMAGLGLITPAILNIERMQSAESDLLEESALS